MTAHDDWTNSTSLQDDGPDDASIYVAIIAYRYGRRCDRRAAKSALRLMDSHRGHSKRAAIYSRTARDGASVAALLGLCAVPASLGGPGLMWLAVCFGCAGAALITLAVGDWFRARRFRRQAEIDRALAELEMSS